MSEIQTKGEKAFKLLSYCLVALMAIIAIAPFLLIFIASITDETALVANGYSYFPNALSMDAYEYLFDKAGTILKAYGISVFVTVFGTAVTVFLTPMLAYPLSRKDFKYRNVISFIVFFTMLFNGGVVPSYIMWTKLFHLSNTVWALILPNYLITAVNVFLVRNYFATNVPAAVIESARIDGASELRIYFKIMLPLSVPVIATIALFTGLIYWNDWTNSIYYITSPKLYSIQYYLMVLMQDIQFLQSGSASAAIGGSVSMLQMPATSIRMALAVIGVLPIVIIFPFFQKYFVKGVVMGAVKG